MVIFAWSGFPQYAARCVGAFVRQTTGRVMVVATRPRVPVVGMEALCGCPVIWIGPNENFIVDSRVDSLIVSGWSIPAFNRMVDIVSGRGGRVICMVDNNFYFSLRECIKAVRFRLFLKRRYDGFFVPGKSGRKLLRFYGVPDRQIAEGLYSADSSIFHDGLPLQRRPKKIVYVGQLCERKNVMRLCRAFVASAAPARGWELHLYGCGPQAEAIKQLIKCSCNTGICLHDFLQPEELAEQYRESRAFVLPSIEEHWGVVVHEAALSGCILLLSDKVGAKNDFLSVNNGFSFTATHMGAIQKSFERLLLMDDNALNLAQSQSLALAKCVSLDIFITAVERLLRCG